MTFENSAPLQFYHDANSGEEKLDTESLTIHELLKSADRVVFQFIVAIDHQETQQRDYKSNSAF